MLTVFREMAHSISRRLAHMQQQRLGPDTTPEEQDALLAEVLEKAIEDGEAAVERTTDQLPALADAGVVDAGAYGLVLILSGIVAGLRGEMDSAPAVAHHEPAKLSRPHHESSRYRYCTNFIVTGKDLDSRAWVPRLEEIGDSVLVVGDEATLKVHVHTDEPESAVGLFDRDGEVMNLDVADMREQIEERQARLQAGKTGVLAVASGGGMKALFEGLGAHVVDGGPTFNPSTYELLAGIHQLPSEEVLVLPNNPNVVMAAERAADLSEKPAQVVGCTSQQAGLLAMVELDPQQSREDNAQRLNGALESISVAAVAPAARDDTQGRFIRGDAVGFVDDEIVAWGGAGSTLAAVVERLAQDAEIVTVIGGENAPIRLDEIESHVPRSVELELQDGGQAHYWWLLAAQ
jgi:dihydroxyacetone kinase-like predicted kinase